MDIEIYLRRIGMKTFVEHYEIFDDLTIDRQEILAILEKENFTIKSCNTKASVGRSIFKKDMNRLALEIIINSNRVDSNIKEKAKKLFSNKNLRA